MSDQSRDQENQPPGFRLSSAKRILLEKLLQEEGFGAATKAMIPRRNQDLPAPLSSAQQRLWFLHHLEGSGSTYNVPYTYRLRGALNISALQRSLEILAQRQEILRTTFRLGEQESGIADSQKVPSQPYQVIFTTLDLDISPIDLSSIPVENQEAEIQRQAKELGRKIFDLQIGPLLRGALLRLSADDHVLCLCFHHSIFDEWSAEVFSRELGLIYLAESTGQPVELPDLPVQYADYAAWQQEQLKSGIWDRQLAYWKQKLAGASPVLDLPTDHPHLLVQSSQGSVGQRWLSLDLLEALKRFSQAERVTLFTTLLAAFEVLLYRYSGQADFLIGTPIANRQQAGIEFLIGFFLNTLVMRSCLNSSLSFRSMLNKVGQDVLEAFDNQDLPFERLVEILKPGRDLSRQPLFQVMFVSQPFVDQQLTLAGLQVEPVQVDYGWSKFDLTLFAIEQENSLLLRLEYNSDLYETATIERMLGHYQRLLEGLLETPDLPVGLLPLLSGEEEVQFQAWNTTAHPYPAHMGVHQMFEAQVRRAPDREAVYFLGQRLSYGELNCRTNQLAHYLRSLGVGPEVLVGVCLDRSLDMVVAILGVLKAGGAYVPLDLTYPAERLAYMLRDARAQVLLTEREQSERLGAVQTRMVCLDSHWDEISRQPVENPTNLSQPQNSAYVIYTSGSTGAPKGAVITHQALSNHMTWMQEVYPLHEDDSVFQKTPFSFDASVWEFYAPLLVGARLVMAAPGGHRDITYLIQEMNAQQITILQTVPSLLRILVEDDRFKGCTSLRRIFCGGEAIPAELPGQVFAALDVELINLYGPAEACINTVTWNFPREASDLASSMPPVPIGRPVFNVQAFVLDRNLQPLPVGVSGELYLSGDSLGRGYLHHPDWTAEKFIPRPDWLHPPGQPSERLYRTGDLARFLPDGSLEFLGRADFMVKLHGLRLELGEIEAALEGHSAVHRAVVMLRQIGFTESRSEGQMGDDRRLVAYLVLHATYQVSTQELRMYLHARLPEFMIPSIFIFLEALPLTPSGKVDRGALPAPNPALIEMESLFAGPRDELERQLCQVWEVVLGVKPVGIQDNFFELGGHSLLAIRLMVQIEEELGRRLPLAMLFQLPTVAELAEAMRHGAGEATRQVIIPRDASLPAPLSSAQQRLWFLDRLEGMQGTYNVPFAYRLSGELNPLALRASLQALAQRHEILRTGISQIGDQPVQLILPQIDIPLQVDDLDSMQGLSESEKQNRARQMAVDEGCLPFDLSAAPLWRARILRLDEQEHILLFTFHHAIIDEWSADVFFNELRLVYQAQIMEKQADLVELPVQYADYAVWQQRQIEHGAYEEQLAYWKTYLAGAPAALDLPLDHPRPAVQSFCGASVMRELPAEIARCLKQLGQAERVTLFTILLAAFEVLLSRYSGQQDLLVGTPIANRSQIELNNLIGFFLNTLVLRANLQEAPGFRDFLHQVEASLLQAFENQELPFERLVEELRPERDLSRQPLFQVMFVLHPPSLQQFHLAGLQVSPMRLDYGSAKFDLTLFVSEHQNGLRLSLEYSTDLFDQATIERMLVHYEQLLESLLAQPDQAVVVLPMLTETERQTLLSWNETSREYQYGLGVHTFFETQALHAPEQIALVYQDGQLTYGQLNKRANQLANALLQSGVEPDCTVGICLERSPEMIVAILGVLKAGGACVPFDPSYPKMRLEYMLQDAQVKVLVTQTSLVDKFPDTPALVLCLDGDLAYLDNDNVANPAPPLRPDHLAYLLYTSGSTGTPKGVEMPHRPLCNLVAWQLSNPHFAGPARTLQYTSLNFDVSFQEIFSTLSAGGTLVLVSEEIRREPRLLLAYLAEQSIDRLYLPFVALQQLVETAVQWGVDARLKLSEVITAGEQLKTTPQMAAFFTQLPGCTLHNHYGPTESHVVTAYTLQGAPETWPSLPPIGKPVANTQIYLLDPYLQPVPVGVVGELYIGGLALARGYHNQPGMTVERFIPHPFDQSGQRLYRTGDLARYLPDGNIEFLGRRDDQVKLRGYRVELGEIETTLSGHPVVEQAVVLLDESGPGEPGSGSHRLVAYIVLVGEVAPESRESLLQELRTYLKSRLLDYMVPSLFIFIEKLPLTPSGKVNRRALPAPQVKLGQAGSGYLAPRDNLESRLCQLWEQVLGVQPVGIEDNFFELGGHSLLAVRLFVRLEQELGHRLPLAVLFQSPTVAELAALLRQAEPQASWSALVPIQPEGTAPAFFCVHNFGGEVLNYARLAQLLESDQPFFGLQARGLDGVEPPQETIQEMASSYIEAIRVQQPHGPYSLGGYCFGGVVAYEMACQLEKQGEKVALLALFDAYAPLQSRQRKVGLIRRLGNFARNLPFWLRDFMMMGSEEAQAVVKRRLTIMRKKLFSHLGHNAEVTPEDLIGDHAHVHEAPVYVRRLMELHMRALMDYAPIAYGGRVTLFRVQRLPLFSFVEPDGGWGRLAAGGVDLHIIPGLHHDFLRSEHVRVLAEELKSSLKIRFI
ncbi:MAG: amino acid adenylation domain-containing protein [Anaerolineales bacterium]|nr:amino acid adenylation domain-containing protein [Anaerolineales bacterium]